MKNPYKEVDKILKTTNKKYNAIYDDIENELIPYLDELNIVGNKSISEEEKKALKAKYLRYKWKHELAKLYAIYYISKPIQKKIDKIYLKTLEILDNNYVICDNINVGIMRDIAYIGYDNCLKDIGKKNHKTKIKEYNGKDYSNAKLISDANKIRNQILYNNELDFKKLKNEWINVKDNKFSGYLEVESEKIYNDYYLKACQDYGVEEVEFIAIIDTRTTKMCESLNGQRFKLNAYNTFTRYYDSAGREETNKVYGLKQGINLPPIDDHFHYCRSYIQAVT